MILGIPTLKWVDDLYKCTQSALRHRIVVNHNAFFSFSDHLSRLDRALGEAAQDSMWKAVLSPLRRMFWDCSMAPISFAMHPFQGVLAQELEKNIHFACRYYPMHTTLANQLLETALALCNLDENLLLQAALDRLNDEDSVAFLPLCSRAEIHNLIPAPPNVKLVTPKNIRQYNCFDKLFVFGPTVVQSFPDHILQTPNAMEVYIVHYGIFRPKWRPKKSLPGNEKELFIGTEYFGDSSGVRAYGELPDVMVPQIMVPRSNETLPTVGEPIAARLVELAGDVNVFIAAEGEVWTIDPSHSDLITKRSTTKLVSGDFLAFRTGGGGDIIVDIANQILGDKAGVARKWQARWKKRLRRRVKQVGLHQVCIELTGHGAIRATETNVRNWIDMDESRIRPADKQDFAAIMRIIGLGHRIEAYWDRMRDIFNAHSSAGKQLTIMLKDHLRESDLSQLIQIGFGVFSLDEFDSVSLDVYRIEAISDTIQDVPRGAINRPFGRDE